MPSKRDWTTLIIMAAVFSACYWLPVGRGRFDNAETFDRTGLDVLHVRADVGVLHVEHAGGVPEVATRRRRRRTLAGCDWHRIEAARPVSVQLYLVSESVE